MASAADIAARLCREYIAAEKGCFDRWCELLDGRRSAPVPEAVVASQMELHQAAGRLRAWCLTDPAQAEARRHQLMTDQVEGELAAEAAVQAHRDAETRQRIRSDWVTTRWDLICQRDALTCGLGWPHRGEPVTVSTWCYDRTGERQDIAGEGIYLGAYDIYGVSHEVWMPQLAARRREATVIVAWTSCREDMPLGPAGPAGNIALRVREAPQRKLPVPLMRWPKPADVGIVVPGRPEPHPGLFELTDIPGLPAVRPPGISASRSRRTPVSPAPPAENPLF